jgi:hypothetical protein
MPAFKRNGVGLLSPNDSVVDRFENSGSESYPPIQACSILSFQGASCCNTF